MNVLPPIHLLIDDWVELSLGEFRFKFKFKFKFKFGFGFGIVWYSIG